MIVIHDLGKKDSDLSVSCVSSNISYFNGVLFLDMLFFSASSSCSIYKKSVYSTSTNCFQLFVVNQSKVQVFKNLKDCKLVCP